MLYFDWLSFIPAVFLLPVLPLIKRLFLGVDIEKFSYGASTSGILLTFYGIWIGLAGFDTADIEGSIPILLDGFKVAFGSSLTGLGTSMLINIFFLDSKDDVEQSLESMSRSIEELKDAIDKFMGDMTEMQSESLGEVIRELLDTIEAGINEETKDSIAELRVSIEFLREWQEKYLEEIKVVTEAMDKNARVTEATTQQLDRTNDVLEELGPVTERIAESIGWVQKALPTMRKRN
jgi:hypothetical protein